MPTRFFICYFSLTLFFLLASLEAMLDPASISRQGQAQWAVQDYAGANRLYEGLLNQPLAGWQKARLYYNLGTLRLAQRHPMEAFDFFQKVVPSDLSIPQTGRDLLIHTGIGNLQEIASSEHFGIAPFFIRQARQAFAEAKTLDCDIQKQEQQSDLCVPYSLIEAWNRQANHLFQENIKQRQEDWLKKASKEQLSALLHLQLQQIREQMDGSPLSYFHSQLDSLTPIWNHLQNQPFSPEQKTSFNQALDSYLRALQENDQTKLMAELDSTQKALALLAFQQDTLLENAFLQYQVALLLPSLSASPVKALQQAFETLTVPKEQENSLRSLQALLKQSVEAIEAYRPLEAQFFLLAGFSKGENLLPKKNLDSADLLRKAIDQSKRALQLAFLAEGLEKKERNPSLKEEQQEVLVRVQPFIPAILQEQKERFSRHHCQQFPWDQLIPLFDHGVQTAQLAMQELTSSSFAYSALISLQEQTVQNWEEALSLLLHPPSVSEDNRPPINKTLRMLQEMYQEDQSHPEQQMSELHTW